MIEHPLASLDAWVRYFEASDIPILAHSRDAMQSLAQRGDDATVLDLARIVRHDALLALQVLRYLQQHRSSHQHTEVTTVERVILMLGVDPLLKAYAHKQTVEELLQDHPHALEAVRQVLSRAWHAAHCASVWAEHRHDIDGGEVQTAALLRDIAEILVGCFAPRLLLRVRAMQQMDKRLRSQLAQRTVLGFPLIDLQLTLVEQWRLPPILKQLMDEHHAEHPRVRTVATAVAYARHSATSWQDAALPDDYLAAAELTGLGYDKVRYLTLEASRKAHEAWPWYSQQEPPPPPAFSLEEGEGG
ncbi:HDOD domain-containing protein [Chitinimonas sp.]|uniref:HDOD domain-containing protein n=1 Tax=Chitinimonas sp. TaxID=1934313 RepID=UPI002F953A38